MSTPSIDFIRHFRATATQLNGHRIAGDWMRLARLIPTLTPAEAAAWADLGYMPDEAEPLIRAGITAEQHRAAEKQAELEAGGKDELAGQRIAELLAQPGWLGPDDVTRVVDPFNPGIEVIGLPSAE